MRWVDIDKLKLPEGWNEQADNALNSLREEIEKAEQDARTAREDVASARKKAITEGLKKRQRVWRDLAPHLAILQNNKCWYSESNNPGSNKDVDHFRPKNEVAEDPTHEGYWWLAFESDNYRYSCQLCNQKRVKATTGTEGGKGVHFPLAPESFRARLEEHNWKHEEVELLDPIDPEDWKLLTFLPNGQPIPTKDEGTREYDRAITSIQVYHLHYREFVSGRKLRASTIRTLIEDMEIAHSKMFDPDMKVIYKSNLKKLLQAIAPDYEYSAAALAYARAEIYKIERGHQVKRQWLEDILNSNP
ncbi:MAG: hypothetical protein HEQ33_07045 [Dolichospermum sp. WA123]|nr:hypothetical protein [Dolichospermum sp. WA123]